MDVTALIDAAPVGRRQREIFLLCGLVAVLDGFNTQSIPLLAPTLAAAWHMPLAQFAPILSATLLGSLIGVTAAGRLADLSGRRALTIAAVGIFAVVTLASAASGSMPELISCRVPAGFGLGGAIPGAAALEGPEGKACRADRVAAR